MSSFQNDIKISLPIRIKRVTVVLVWYITKITCELKSNLKKRDFSRQFYPQSYDVEIFVQNIYTWLTGKSLQFAAKAVLMNKNKNFMIFNFTIFPSSLCILNNFSLYSVSHSHGFSYAVVFGNWLCPSIPGKFSFCSRNSKFKCVCKVKSQSSAYNV